MLKHVDYIGLMKPPAFSAEEKEKIKQQIVKLADLIRRIQQIKAGDLVSEHQKGEK